MKNTEMIDLCGVYHQSLRFLHGLLLVLHQPFMTDVEENFVLFGKTCNISTHFIGTTFFFYIW